MNRLLISGVSGGGGKTLLSLGLGRALTQRGCCVKPFKKGPDYIDAAWLARACCTPCTNLDPYFLDQAQLRALFAHASQGADLALIEGNRGLYDGRDVDGSCSTATLARTLDAPVILSLNCTKMTRTAAAVLAGLATFEPLHLAGVVLNQVGTARHETLVRQSIETYTDIPVFGALPRLQPNPIPERHMGLSGLDANANVEQCLNTLADFVRDHVDLDAVSRAAAVPPLPPAEAFWSAPVVLPCAPRIGYVLDETLWFYYEENLEALTRAGAELVRLSLFDASPWPALDGLYLGGGFPELDPARLAASPRLADIRALSENNVPIYAECGGLMVLCNALHVHGERFPMAGVLPAESSFCKKPQGLGYVDALVEHENPFHPVGTCLRGHEFHYSRCFPDPEATLTLRLTSGIGVDCTPGTQRDGLLVRNTFAAYLHIFAPAHPHWATRFVQACLQGKG